MKIGIIGAGMAGLSAARELAREHDVHIFDKSRGVGGRMSTRYAGDYEFDHGAQYFTVSDAEWQADIESEPTVKPWASRGVYLKRGLLTVDTGRDRWVGAPRMNAVPKAMAEELTVTLGHRAASVSGRPGHVVITFEDGSTQGPFDHVICTAPAPQATLLIPSDSALQPIVSQVAMHACFALMVGWPAGEEGLFDPGWDSMRVTDLPISWLALNHAKPGRSNTHNTLMVHASPEWSDTHQDADRAWVQGVMIEAASALCGVKLDQAPHIALHRWLYAYSDEGVGQDCLQDPVHGLTLAGDWCVGGRVEGAVLSGRAAARSLLNATRMSGAI